MSLLLQISAGSAGATGPFAALTLIVAPAMLTNVTAVLVLSTSNRLARAVDLGRTIGRELEADGAGQPAEDVTRRLRDLAAANARSLMLLRALRAIYAAMAGFASATLTSLVGVVMARGAAPRWLVVPEMLALAAGVVGVTGIVWAALLLFRETRIAVTALNERVAAQQRRFALGGGPAPGVEHS